MVDVAVHHDNVVFTIQGAHKVFALKNQLTIPRAHVTGVRPDPEAAQHIEGLRAGGTHVPGVITAGTFYLDNQGSQKPSFLDVSNPANTVVIALRNEEYHQLIIEVKDPEAVVALLAISG
ncbi:hypothetical protein I2I05_02390 [Hymenobacter sp. BT683]|uniref:Bacterial Pleckstrin homology domain-containing protein n=1 Tax=Hymenobacter jeongseonensis TaxID=2791027 RepID=A0ABS0ID10_9BACT|nr:hypothetical protein [Hymenobacter jeongseonensis]MBF9236234.1 hypothetical protein [Hymenobacter jeongseonensis]